MTKSNSTNAFLEMEFPAEVWLASADVPLGKLLDLREGEVLTLPDNPEESVDLVVNGVIVAKGELVVVEGRFGLRVTSTATQLLAGLQDGVGENDEQ